jgi:uncharacterized short protein YbdD (DUF466 family)
MVIFDINKVREQIENLKLLPNVKEVIALRKRLERELENLSVKEESLIEKFDFSGLTKNQKISRSLKKYNNYLRQIRNQFPELSYAEIRREFSKKRKGEKSSIADVVWQNPSP